MPKSLVYFGIMSVLLLCVSMIGVFPSANPAGATKIFDRFKEGKCAVPPSWGEVFYGPKRWVKKMRGAAYCDRQTGLVWEQSPDTERLIWRFALEDCLNRTVGENGQKGWRLPSIPELASLISTNSPTCNAGAGSVCLPKGHPFDQVELEFYWSATTSAASTTDSAWLVNMEDGNVSRFGVDDPTHEFGAWCVRGAMSADAY